MTMRTILRRELKAALKERDQVAVAALRSALAAIDNAEAVPGSGPENSTVEGEHIAGAAVGNGAGDAPRRELTATQVRAIIEGELHERSSVAKEYEELGRGDRAQRLRAEAEVLGRCLTPDP